jgi:hypothetical protein
MERLAVTVRCNRLVCVLHAQDFIQWGGGGGGGGTSRGGRVGGAEGKLPSLKNLTLIKSSIIIHTKS